MNILVVGCGKMGAQLSNSLCALGHDVAVIDSEPQRFQALDNDFTGYTVTGVPIDQDILREAGIEACDALTAVTEDDNMNVMVCQLAREIFHVPRVLARIYDPRRSDVFSEFGLNTICPTNLSVEAMLLMLTDQKPVKNLYLDSATVSFSTVQPSTKQIGCTLGQLSAEDSPQKVLFGLLHPDGNLTLGFGGSRQQVTKADRLLYANVID